MHDREYDLQGLSFLTCINSPTAYSTPGIRVHQFTFIQRRGFTRVLPSVDALQAAYEVTSLTHACHLHANEASLSFCSQIYVS